MAKKKLDKEAERTSSSPGKIAAILKNETVHFVIGLMLVIFSVYLLLAFSSFFFTGAADQSIIDSGNPADLSAVNNHVKNYAGSRGAQLAHYLINDCFGVSSFFILVFLAVAGLKLMRVRVVRFAIQTVEQITACVFKAAITHIRHSKFSSSRTGGIPNIDFHPTTTRP